MIVYSSTKTEFRNDVRNNRIEDKILDAYKRNLGGSTSPSEIASWRNSMMYMSNVLEDQDIPDDTGVAIEYKIPPTSKRIDILLTGKNEQQRHTIVIVELKQWSEVEVTDQDAIVRTFVGGAVREMVHPAYQAWTYASLLEDFNEAVEEHDISINPCAYLHNMECSNAIRDERYEQHISKAPVFTRADAQKLTEFIKKSVKYGDSGQATHLIENGKIRPSKNLADEVLSMIEGNEEFLMIDDQKVVYERALKLARASTATDKHVLIVEGGPGTGKSVVAINLLVQTTGEQIFAQYVTKNAAPRAVYESVLTGSFKKSHISNLFSGSGAYTNTPADFYDVLVVDEAHRLNSKSGLYGNLGENQIKEIIDSAKFTIFFIDEDQRIHWKDIGEKSEIVSWAKQLGATVHNLELASQFRCNGSDGYLSWITNVLGIRETANEKLDELEYDFQVFDSPVELRDSIIEKNEENNKSRLVAGYCWPWVTKKSKDPLIYDIDLDGFDFKMKWNLTKDGSLWIRKPESVNEIGCIHTCQGLEVDYIGVIIGDDFVVREGKVVIQPEERAKNDQTLKGFKKAFTEDEATATKKAEMIVKNTYRTLMTRGQKGCYIYCTDPETRLYFQQQMMP